MSEIDPLKIVKWILIVLVAGFIGQFGKMLATHILQRIRAKQGKSGSPGKEPAPRGGEMPAVGTAGTPAVPRTRRGSQENRETTQEGVEGTCKNKKEGAGGRKEAATPKPPPDGDGR
jgi:hypothetical protein